MPPASPVLRPLTLLTLLYATLLLYASLMPYDFSTSIDWSQLVRQRLWDHWPFNPRGRISGSDLLSNLLLYQPLGLLLASRWRCAGRAALPTLLLSSLLCATLSLSIELLQGMTASRTPSATDWLLNSGSGALGALVGVWRGADWWPALVRWLQHRWHERPLDILTLALLGLLLADALTPFLPTISLAQLGRSFRQAQFNPIDGLARHPAHWWLMTRILPGLVLTSLLARWGQKPEQPDQLRRWLRAAGCCGLFSLLLELAKLGIVARSPNLANPLTTLVGAVLALPLGPVLRRASSGQLRLTLAVLALLGYSFYLAWTPFNFTWNSEQIANKLPKPRELLPLYHYAMGGSLEHARLFLQTLVLQGLLIYLLRLRLAIFTPQRYRLPLALVLMACLGLLQEGGQLLLPGRTPAATDIYCFLLGGALGALLPVPPALIDTTIKER
ncbi:VanZ family protein [Desulfuromonas thiophila]|uniref:VanZ family protein n=1 Tax=Desulfuromonas thiophila TaxID=57664 RepID=UPI0024A859B3|nr:VanZ family protein [Desulfuromonas thiophila]